MITKSLQELDNLKKVCLIAESYDTRITAIPKNSNTIEELYNNIIKTKEEIIQKLEKEGIPVKELMTEDYEKYTDKYYHRKFWNEIELPEEVELYFRQFKRLTNTEYDSTKKYALCLYDMSDEDLFFETEEKVEAFIEEEDVAPATLYLIKEKYYEEIYSI